MYGHKDIPVDSVNELDQELQKASLRPAAIHLDIDCLDTTPGKANEYAAPGRLSSDDSSRCMGLVLERASPVAMTVASYNRNLGDRITIAEAAIDAIWEVVASVQEI